MWCNAERNAPGAAPAAVDCYNEINLLYGTLQEFCTPETCATMSAGPKCAMSRCAPRRAHGARDADVLAQRQVRVPVGGRADDQDAHPSPRA